MEEKVKEEIILDLRDISYSISELLEKDYTDNSKQVILFKMKLDIESIIADIQLKI